MPKPNTSENGWEPPRSLVGAGAPEIARLPVMARQPAFRSRQIASWIYRKGARDFSEMTNLPGELRDRLAADHSLERLPVATREASRDGDAVKFLFRLADGEAIEAVLLRAPRRDTICISTQAGCAYGCRFCATGAMGLRRNLNPHEIISQVLVIRDALAGLGATGFFNLVFMGMGEPLANYAAVVAGIRVLHDDFGLGVGRRRITVSTVGLPTAIRALAREPVAVRLALSLNATDNETRSSLMPVNRRYPIEEVLAALTEYGERTGSRVTLEYVLIRDVNDSLADARRLARMAREVGAKVNLIRFNPNPLTPLQASPAERVDAFHAAMLPIAPAVTLRESRGVEIRAACGQLSTAYRPEGGSSGGAGGGEPGGGGGGEAGG
ncbi:MAG: 23S rRNA (adenine(2503)-C(2))-methyltransferase RlmN [Candidatus Eisenbacteria sp.]|nr:23S rRNA (adenine(2503)-C(2))-methyltransferase RlmN [Candidatus Eisenbacteria bacterium]